eukprot:s304_g55.t1
MFLGANLQGPGAPDMTWHTAAGCKRRSAWPLRHCRRSREMNSLADLSRQEDLQEPWLVLRKFVSEAERLLLLESALTQMLKGKLLPNPAGPRRFFRRLDTTGGVDSLIEALTQRLELAVAELKGRPRDQTLGRVCSYIDPGGFIHEHRDKYTSTGPVALAHLRANIVVQMDQSGRPIIAGKTVPVEEGDVWIFFASHELHATAPIQGLKPRIVFGFGWSVPTGFVLRAAGEEEKESLARPMNINQLGAQGTTAHHLVKVLTFLARPAAMMMSGSSDVSMPTGLKGKLASLEDFISMQNEELAAQRQEIESLRSDKAGIEEHYQGQLQELKKTMVGDVQRLQDEVRRHFTQQKAENSRLQQQITTLKGEKTSLQQQILGLQRRLQEIEEQLHRLTPSHCPGHRAGGPGVPPRRTCQASAHCGDVMYGKDLCSGRVQPERMFLGTL